MANRLWASKLALAAAILVLTASIVLYNRVQSSQNAGVQTMVDTYSRVFTARLEERIRTRLALVEMLRSRLEADAPPDIEKFRSRAESYFEYFRDIQAINWVEPDGTISAVVPLEANRAALGLQVNGLEVPGRTLRAASEAGALRVTPPLVLTQGGHGFVGYSPVMRGGELAGFVNIAFQSEPLIDNTIGAHAAESFLVRITDTGLPLYGAEFPAAVEPYVQTSALSVAGRRWTIAVAPTPALLLEGQSLLDELILALGVALSISTGFLAGALNRSQDRLRDREERFALAMRGASDGLFDWNAQTRHAYFSPRWFQMLGYEPGELPMEFNTFLRLLHPADAARISMDPEEIGRTSGEISENEFRMRHKNGSWVNILSRAHIVRRGGKVVRLVGTHVDITELRRQQRDLERAAMTDELTGLQNRHRLHERLRALAEALEPGERLAILHIDLDTFKSVNDTSGHEAGDRVLSETARRLTARIPQNAVLARVGGDEFLLVMATRASNERIHALATDLIESVSQPILYAGLRSRVGASIGVSFHGPGASLDQVIADADIALNSAKGLGRGRCVFFEPWMRDAAMHTAVVSDEIREGLGRGEFESFYQPQVELGTGRILGFEALLRWNHPTRGVLGAAEFVPYAEKAHIVERIDDEVFRSACALIPVLTELGLPEASVSVNMSTAQLSGPELVGRLIRRTTEAGVAPDRLHIEILESTLLSERTANVVENVHSLAAAGFKLELDDFGTGHTAIASLRNFPVYRIKIDKSLIRHISSDDQLQAITGAIIDLGRKLRVEVLAEGIETEAELRFLERYGCDSGQGFHIAEPMPVATLRDWIADWQARQARGRPLAAVS